MTSSPVRPENWGGNADQPAGLHAPAGTGSAWGCHIAPPSWLTSSAPARSLQSVVSQPSRGFANTMPVLSHAVLIPLGPLAGGPGACWVAGGGGLAPARVQRAPPSGGREIPTRSPPLAPPRSISHPPCPGSAKLLPRASPGDPAGPPAA